MTEQSKPVEQSEQLPLSSFYKVMDSVTIFKSEKWWEAIVIIESFGKRSIAMYLWQNRDGKWKRKHKFQIRNMQEWEKVKGAIDRLAPQLFGQNPPQ
jgi:hypothetical protein